MSFGDTRLPDYWPLMVAYHQVREPLLRALIRDTTLPAAARILDAGYGDCFYSQLLAEAVGLLAQIVATDIDLALLNSAADLRPNIQRCLIDLDRPGHEPAIFDAIWLCRTMQSVHDPIARLAALAPLLRPGGRFIEIENDTAHNPILAVPAEFELSPREERLESEMEQCRTMTPTDMRAAIQAQVRAWETGAAQELADGFTLEGEIVASRKRLQRHTALRETVTRFASRHHDVRVTLRRIVCSHDCAAVEYRWEDSKNDAGERYVTDDAVWVDFDGDRIARWREYWDTETPKSER